MTNAAALNPQQYADLHILLSERSILQAHANQPAALPPVAAQHLRMSGVYWGLMSMALMGRDLREEMGAVGLANWVMRCQHECGG